MSYKTVKEVKKRVPENEYFSEGILSQLKKSILDNIPIGLREMCNDLAVIHLDQEVSRIVSQYLIKEIRTDASSYERSQAIESDDLKKLVKRKRYYIEKLKKELEDDYRCAVSKQAISGHPSPFNESTLATLLSTARMPRAVAIETISTIVNDYLEKISNMAPIKRGEEYFVGFYEYPYFMSIAEGNPQYASKLLQIDIEEFVFRLSFTKKYAEFAYFSAESVGKGFYTEPIRSKKEDVQYEMITTQYLQSTFFPEETGIVKASIEAKKPWDVKDMELFSYLCTKCVTKGIGNKDILTVDGNLNEICRIIFPDSHSYGAKSYANARKRLENMVGTTVVATSEDGKSIARNIFEQSVVDDKSDLKDGEKSNGVLYHVEFGRNVTADILSHRLSTVIKPNLDELVNPVSRFLYVQLKKDRLMDLYLSREKIRHEYTLIWLMLIFRVREAKKAARILRYSEAFDEMRDKHLLIKDYSVADDQFTIEWLPLSEAEINDVKYIKGDKERIIETAKPDSSSEMFQ